MVTVGWGMVDVTFWGSGANKKTDTFKKNILCFQWFSFPFRPNQAELIPSKPLFYMYLLIVHYLMLDGLLVKELVEVLGLLLVFHAGLIRFSRPALSLEPEYISLPYIPRIFAPVTFPFSPIHIWNANCIFSMQLFPMIYTPPIHPGKHGIFYSLQKKLHP